MQNRRGPPLKYRYRCAGGGGCKGTSMVLGNSGGGAGTELVHWPGPLPLRVAEGRRGWERVTQLQGSHKYPPGFLGTQATSETEHLHLVRIFMCSKTETCFPGQNVPFHPIWGASRGIPEALLLGLGLEVSAGWGQGGGRVHSRQGPRPMPRSSPGWCRAKVGSRSLGAPACALAPVEPSETLNRDFRSWYASSPGFKCRDWSWG